MQALSVFAVLISFWAALPVPLLAHNIPCVVTEEGEAALVEMGYLKRGQGLNDNFNTSAVWVRVGGDWLVTVNMPGELICILTIGSSWEDLSMTAENPSVPKR